MKYLCLLIGALLVTGCITTENLKQDDLRNLKSNEAIVVIGLLQNYRVHLQSGKVSDGAWHMPFSTPEANLFPENGYIVVKLPVLKPSESYSIPMVLPTGIGLGASYIPCNGTTVPTFTIQPGMVNYVGDISYSIADGKLSFESSFEETKAKNYLSNAYPELLELYKPSPITPLKAVGTECKPIIFIAIPR